jgi:hypothetical protein
VVGRCGWRRPGRSSHAGGSAGQAAGCSGVHQWQQLAGRGGKPGRPGRSGGGCRPVSDCQRGGAVAWTRPKQSRGWRCWQANGLQRWAPGAAARRQVGRARPVGAIRWRVTGRCRPGSGARRCGWRRPGRSGHAGGGAGRPAGCNGVHQGQQLAGRPGRSGRSGGRWPAGVGLAAVPGGAGGVDQVGAVTLVAMLAGRRAVAVGTMCGSSRQAGWLRARLGSAHPRPHTLQTPALRRKGGQAGHIFAASFRGFPLMHPHQGSKATSHRAESRGTGTAGGKGLDPLPPQKPARAEIWGTGRSSPWAAQRFRPPSPGVPCPSSSRPEEGMGHEARMSPYCQTPGRTHGPRPDAGSPAAASPTRQGGAGAAVVGRLLLAAPTDWQGPAGGSDVTEVEHFIFSFSCPRCPRFAPVPAPVPLIGRKAAPLLGSWPIRGHLPPCPRQVVHAGQICAPLPALQQTTR